MLKKPTAQQDARPNLMPCNAYPFKLKMDDNDDECTETTKNSIILLDIVPGFHE